MTRVVNFWTGLVVGYVSPKAVQVVVEMRRRRKEREGIAEWGRFQAAALRVMVGDDGVLHLENANNGDEQGETK